VRLFDQPGKDRGDPCEGLVDLTKELVQLFAEPVNTYMSGQRAKLVEITGGLRVTVIQDL
jgi:hypothetical protein